MPTYRERINKRASWSVLLSFAPWFMRRYDINRDEFVRGWWLWGLGFSIETTANVRFKHDIAFRITWGWVPTRFVKVDRSVRTIPRKAA